MNFIKEIKSGAILRNSKVAAALWFGLSFIAVLIEALKNKINNYIIFEHVFIHTTQQVNLYLPYPQQYADVNLYGPLFSLVIAPFALLPNQIGVVLWVMANVSFLYYAIRQLPIKKAAQNTILILCSVEMMNVASWLQSNALVAACIILTWTSLQKSKESSAAFFLLLATFIKLYGIVAFAFFFFSKKPFRFILWLIIWSAIFFVTPMIISSTHFIIQSYADWYEALVHKAEKNIRLDIKNDYQDISIMGLIRRTFYPSLNDKFVIIAGIVLFASQYLQYKYFSNIACRLYMLCTVLIFTVIFSTGSESPTYIIALLAICLWYVMQPPAKWITWFMIFSLIITSFSYSDLLTPWFRTNIARPYAIKALPSCILFFVLIFQMYKKQFLMVRNVEESA